MRQYNVLFRKCEGCELIWFIENNIIAKKEWEREREWEWGYGWGGEAMTCLFNITLYAGKVFLRRRAFIIFIINKTIYDFSKTVDAEKWFMGCDIIEAFSVNYYFF